MPTIIPVANRGTARLIAAATTLPLPTQDYLKAQPPACSCLGSGLVALIIFTFIGLSIRYFYCRICHRAPLYDTLPFYGSAFEKVEGHKESQGSGPSEDDHRQPSQKDGKMVSIRKPQGSYADAEVLQQDNAHASNLHWVKGSESRLDTATVRPPPAPPFTPPELSTTTTIYFQGPLQRHESFEMDENPDYFSATSSPESEISPVFSAPVRRRSYTRSVPVDISSSQETASPDQDHSKVPLSTSYPPSEGLLPPAPPSLTVTDTQEDPARTHVHLHGEIISSTDQHGAGWTRHTRVFGGGPCLACAASGSGSGGFYGPNVRPEDMMH